MPGGGGAVAGGSPGVDDARGSPGSDRALVPTASTLVAVSTTVWALGFVAAVVFFCLWIYCLFDLLARPSRGAGSKALWAVALVLLAPFAIIAYLVFGRRRAD